MEKVSKWRKLRTFNGVPKKQAKLYFYTHPNQRGHKKHGRQTRVAT